MALYELMSHTVHVVSIEEVTTREGLIAFQENEVSGAGEIVGGDFDFLREYDYEYDANGEMPLTPVNAIF
jgi:hypothetical protein